MLKVIKYVNIIKNAVFVLNRKKERIILLTLFPNGCFFRNADFCIFSSCII